MKSPKRPWTRLEKSLCLAPLLLALLGGWFWWQRGNEADIPLFVPGLNFVRYVRFSPDGRRLLVVFNHKNPRIPRGEELNPYVNQIDDTAVYDVATRSKVYDLRSPASGGEIEWPVWSPDSTLIAARGDSFIGIWNARNGQLQRSWPYHFQFIDNRDEPRVEFSSDGKSVFGEETPRVVFDVHTGKPVHRVVYEPDRLFNLAHNLGVVQSENAVEVRAVPSQSVVWKHVLSHSDCQWEWSPNENRLAILEADGDQGEDKYFLQNRVLTVFDVKGAVVFRHAWKLWNGSPASLDWSPDSKRLAVGLADGVKLVSVES